MGSEELEYDEFQPMWDEVKETLGDKKVVLFGSYSWAEGEWMDNWKADADEEGVNVVDSVICYDAPDDQSEAACRRLEPSSPSGNELRPQRALQQNTFASQQKREPDHIRLPFSAMSVI